MLKIIKHNLSVYFMVLASLDFALVGACAKILSSEGLPSIEVVFFRNLIAAMYLYYLFKKSTLKSKEGGHFGLLVFRGVSGVLSLYLLFYNIEHITLGGAYSFQKTAPIFTTLIAFFVFRESIGFRGWLAVLVGFCGVLLVAQPFASEEFHTGFDTKNCLLGVLCGFFSAMSVVSARKLRHFYTTEKIALSFMAVGTLVPLASMMIGKFYAPKELDFIICEFNLPNLKSMIFIVVMGILGALYQIHLTKSYGIAKKAGIVAGVSYLDVVFSLILGLFLGDSFPSAMVFMGILGIISSGIILVLSKI
ncbi:DMT family transporter [Helicobacter sp. T3_23-1059]